MNVRGKGYRPKVGDVVVFKKRVRGRLHTSEGWITGINSDRTYEIHVTSGFHYSGILRRYIIEKLGEHTMRKRK
jgi:hypothetical protein